MTSPQEINDNPCVNADIAGDAGGGWGDPTTGILLGVLLCSALLATGISLHH